MKDKLITKYIYGAGKYGRALLKHFRAMGDKIDFFVQTEVSEETYIDGIQVKAIADIEDNGEKDNVFDYVISNHVMEHIVNEEKAVSEVIRVLKPDGKWIFSFPICMEFKTYEDDSVVTEEQRLKAYGQKDHVRLYGNDFKERFEKYGLKLKVYSPKDELSPELIKRWGLIADDVIICANKR